MEEKKLVSQVETYNQMLHIKVNTLDDRNLIIKEAPLYSSGLALNKV